MSINVDAFLKTLPIMGKGMLGIFIVTLVIILVITILNRITAGFDKNKTEEKQINEKTPQ